MQVPLSDYILRDLEAQQDQDVASVSNNGVSCGAANPEGLFIEAGTRLGAEAHEELMSVSVTRLPSGSLDGD